MKKLFMFLAVAGMATFGVSCSSDDGGSDPDPKELKLSADKTTIEEGDSVTFTVSESGADLYIEGTKVSGLTHTFDTKGDYKVQAKKEGFADSNVVTVKVTEEGEPGEQTLTLSAVPNAVGVGDTVTFIVRDGSNNTVNDATITLVGGSAITGTTWTAEEEGTFTFKASKDGYKDSSEVTVTVEESTPDPTGNVIKVGNTVYDVNYARLMANASQDATDGNWYVHPYADDNGDIYCVFYMDVAELNSAQDAYLARSLVAVAVYQDTTATSLTFPGEGDSGFISAWAVDFATETVVDFELDDITNFSFPTPGANGVVAYDAENNDGHVNYEGNYTGIGVMPVDANGDPIQTIIKSDNRLVAGQKTVQLVKKK